MTSVFLHTKCHAIVLHCMPMSCITSYTICQCNIPFIHKHVSFTICHYYLCAWLYTTHTKYEQLTSWCHVHNMTEHVYIYNIYIYIYIYIHIICWHLHIYCIVTLSGIHRSVSIRLCKLCYMRPPHYIHYDVLTVRHAALYDAYGVMRWITMQVLR